MNAKQAYVLSKHYTDDSLIGLGALKGASCIIKKTEYKDGINYVTFEWTANDGVTKKETQIAIHDGTPVYEYTPGNSYKYGDLVIYQAMFYRCVTDCVAGPTLDPTYFAEIGSPDGNYDIVEDATQLPARFSLSDRKMYYSIDDLSFWLWNGTQWVLQTEYATENEVRALFD